MSDKPVTELYERLMKDYDNIHSSAKALYFMPKYSDKGTFRFECDLGWELVQNWYIGPDPAGDFYYREAYFDQDNKLRLDPNANTWANFYTEVLTENREDYVHVTFYAPGSTTEVLGEFIGKDEFGRATECGFRGLTDSAYWRAVDYDEYPCSASKSNGNKTITIKKRDGTVKVEVDCDPNKDAIFNEAIDDVHGILYVRDSSTVATEGSSVRWYSDYAVFYKGMNTRELAAFFYPDEGHHNPLGSQKEDYDWDCVRWSPRG